jgi:hypothetical protein
MKKPFDKQEKLTHVVRSALAAACCRRTWLRHAVRRYRPTRPKLTVAARRAAPSVSRCVAAVVFQPPTHTTTPFGCIHHPLPSGAACHPRPRRGRRAQRRRRYSASSRKRAGKRQGELQLHASLSSFISTPQPPPPLSHFPLLLPLRTGDSMADVAQRVRRPCRTARGLHTAASRCSAWCDTGLGLGLGVRDAGAA